MAPQVRARSGYEGRLIAGALDRQPRRAPVFFPLHVLAHIRVTQRHQHTGSVRTRGSVVVPTVEHDVGVLVRNETLDGCGYVIGRQVKGARQMVLPIIRLGQHLKKKKRVASFDFEAQLFTRYDRPITHASRDTSAPRRSPRRGGETQRDSSACPDTPAHWPDARPARLVRGRRRSRCVLPDREPILSSYLNPRAKPTVSFRKRSAELETGDGRRETGDWR